MNIRPNWTGITAIAILAVLAAVLAYLDETEAAKLLVATIVGVFVPSPHLPAEPAKPEVSP